MSPNLRLYLGLSALFELGAFSYSFLLLAAKSAGFAIATIPAFYLLFTVAAMLVSYPAGTIADRIGRKPLIFLSFAAWAGVLLLFVFFRHSIPAMIAAFALYGVHKGILDTVQKTFTAELAPKEFVASILGGFQMVIGLCSLPSSLLAGVLWDAGGIVIPFALSIILTLIASFLLFFVREERGKHA